MPFYNTRPKFNTKWARIRRKPPLTYSAVYMYTYTFRIGVGQPTMIFTLVSDRQIYFQGNVMKAMIL